MAVASLGLVAYGSSRAFVPAAQGPAAADASVALRGAAVAEQAVARAGSALPMGAVCASGALAVAAMGQGSTRRSRRVARQSAEEAPAPTPEAETPPPPPFNPATAMGATAPLGYFDPLGSARWATRRASANFASRS